MRAACVATSDGQWSDAQGRPIGPTGLAVYPQKFMPAGTVLFDQTYSMTHLLGGNPDAVVARCTDGASAGRVGTALRLDATYQNGGFSVGGIRYYYTQRVNATDESMHTTVGWKLYGLTANGTPREVVFDSSLTADNPAVIFWNTGHELSTRPDKGTYPRVVMAKHLPPIRLVMVRSPHDDNKFIAVGNGDIGRIGIARDHTTTSATFGYIRFGNYQPTPGAACGVTRVPRTVELGRHPVATVTGGGAAWAAFDVTYECTASNSPVSSLRIGFEPQNRARLAASDSRYLRSDAAAGAAGGVGIVYRRQGESGSRHWVQNSGCPGVSSATQNHSNCYLARSQTQDQGWYRVQPVGGSGAAAGSIEYQEPFEARIEQLPQTLPGAVTAGPVSATVNVLVNQP